MVMIPDLRLDRLLDRTAARGWLRTRGLERLYVQRAQLNLVRCHVMSRLVSIRVWVPRAYSNRVEQTGQDSWGIDVAELTPAGLIWGRGPTISITLK